MAEKPATQAQVDYCKTLFRKSKLYYKMLDDEKLVEEVFKRTNFDLDDLLQEEAEEIIRVLTKVAHNQRPVWAK
jgi:hypothetical protein